MPTDERLLAIDGENLIADAQAGDRRRAGDAGAVGQVEHLAHIADPRRGVFGAHRLAGDPQDAGEEEGEQDVEGRAGGDGATRGRDGGVV